MGGAKHLSRWDQNHIGRVFCHLCYRHHHYSVIKPEQDSWWRLDRRFACKCISMCCPGLSLKKEEKASYLCCLGRTLCCSCFSYQVIKIIFIVFTQFRIMKTWVHVIQEYSELVLSRNRWPKFLFVRPDPFLSLTFIHRRFSAARTSMTHFPRVMKWYEGASEEQLSPKKQNQKKNLVFLRLFFPSYTPSIILVSLSNNSLQRRSDDMHSVSINSGLIAEMAAFLMSTGLNQQWI